MKNPLTVFTASTISLPVFLMTMVTAVAKFYAYPEPYTRYPEYELLKAKALIAVSAVFLIISIVGFAKSRGAISTVHDGRVGKMSVGILLFMLVYTASIIIAQIIIASFDSGLIPQ